MNFGPHIAGHFFGGVDPPVVGALFGDSMCGFKEERKEKHRPQRLNLPAVHGRTLNFFGDGSHGSHPY